MHTRQLPHVIPLIATLIHIHTRQLPHVRTRRAALYPGI
jgi:hypothetical protein